MEEDRLAHPDHQGEMVLTELMVNPVKLDHKAHLPHLAPTQSHCFHHNVHVRHQTVNLGRKDHLVSPDNLGRLEKMVKMANLVIKDLEVHLASPVSLANQVVPDHLENPETIVQKLANLVAQVPLADPDLLDHLVLLVNPDLMENQDNQGKMDLLDHQANPVPMDSQVLQEHLESQALPEAVIIVHRLDLLQDINFSKMNY